MHPSISHLHQVQWRKKKGKGTISFHSLLMGILFTTTSRDGKSLGLDIFNDHSDTLTPADTGRAKAISLPGRLEVVNQMGEDSTATSS